MCCFLRTFPRSSERLGLADTLPICLPTDEAKVFSSGWSQRPLWRQGSRHGRVGGPLGTGIGVDAEVIRIGAVACRDGWMSNGV